MMNLHLLLVGMIIVHWSQAVKADSIKIQPVDLYYGGTNTQPIITCIPTLSCGTTIKWFFERSEIMESPPKYTFSVNILTNQQTLQISDADESDAGEYHCQCTFNSTSVNSPDTTLRHINPVSFGTDDNILYERVVGDNVTLSCDIKDYDEFQWQFSDSSIISTKTDKYKYIGTDLLINNLVIDDERTYQCVGKNKVTTVARLRARVKVFDQPMFIANGDTELMVTEGDMAKFICTVKSHPKSTVSWSKSGGVLKIGGRVSNDQVDLDQFTVQSVLTVKHLTTADSGQYLCTGQSTTVDSKPISLTNSFDLTVDVPLKPFFDAFTIDKSHDSINVGWILSGIASDLVNISWTDQFVQYYQVYAANRSSTVISNLNSNTLYYITASVIDHEYNLTFNVSTDIKIETVSSRIVTSSSQYTSVLVSESPKQSTFTSHLRPRTESTTTSTSTIIIRSTEPTVQGSADALDSDLRMITAVPIGMLLFVAIVIGFVVVLLCIVRRRHHRSSGKNITSLERASSSRSSNVFLTDNEKNGSLSGNSSLNPSVIFTPIHASTPNDFPSKGYHQPAFFDGGPPTYFEGINDPIVMTENPGNVSYEHAKSSQLLPRPSTVNNFNGADSASQIILSSHSQNTFDDDQFFDYNYNANYETFPYKRDFKSRSEPPTPLHEAMHENHTTKKPEFGIVASSKRGAVREQVELKKR